MLLQSEGVVMYKTARWGIPSILKASFSLKHPLISISY